MPQRNALGLTVYRNGLSTTDFEVISIAESTGVEHLDTAHLLYKNLDLEGKEFNSTIVCEEIEIKRNDNNEVLHWGKVSIVPPTLNPQGESLVVVSRTEKFHLGERVNGIWVWNPIQPSTGGGDPIGGAELIADELAFNPIIDGKVYGNLNNTFGDTGSGTGHPLFLDPESVKTTAASTLQGAAGALWPLSKCISYLLETLNADETNVANPSLSTIAAAVNDTDDVVLNLHIPRGTYLAEALDMLLEPLGYRWRVNKTAIGARTYQFFQRNSGDLVFVLLQARGSVLDTGLTNVEAAGLTFDVANLYNQITIVGGYYAYEVTVELARGWSTLYDAYPESEFAKEAEGFATVKDAWRRWVLNEAGDYIGLRTEINGVFTSAFRTDIEAEFGGTIWNEFTPRRRKFAPTLTLGDDKHPIGQQHGIELEYYSGSEWKPIGNWGAQVLEGECGIYFDSEFPPLEEKFEVADRADIRLRATFTLISDKRLEATAIKDVNSPQTDVLPLVVDAPTKFRHQEITTLSKYYASGKPSLAANDNTAIAAFAERVRAVWDLMDVGGAIQLEGLDANYSSTPYRVGQRVQGILGKSLSFRAKTGVEEYPQIVAIERNVNNQTTTIHLQRIKRQVSFGGDPLRSNNRIGGKGRR